MAPVVKKRIYKRFQSTYLAGAHQQIGSEDFEIGRGYPFSVFLAYLGRDFTSAQQLGSISQ